MSGNTALIGAAGVGLFTVMDKMLVALRTPAWKTEGYGWFVQNVEEMQSWAQKMVEAHNELYREAKVWETYGLDLYAKSNITEDERDAALNEVQQLRAERAKLGSDSLGRTYLMNHAVDLADDCLAGLFQSEARCVDQLLTTAAYIITLPRYYTKLGLTQEQITQARNFAADAMMPSTERMVEGLYYHFADLISRGFAAGADVSISLGSPEGDVHLMRLFSSEGSVPDIVSCIPWKKLAEYGTPGEIKVTLEGGPFPVRKSMTLAYAAHVFEKKVNENPSLGHCIDWNEEAINYPRLSALGDAVLNRYAITGEEQDLIQSDAARATTGKGAFAGWIYEQLLQMPINRYGKDEPLTSPVPIDSPIVQKTLARLGLSADNIPDGAADFRGADLDVRSAVNPPAPSGVFGHLPHLASPGQDFFADLKDAPIQRYRRIERTVMSLMKIKRPELEGQPEPSPKEYREVVEVLRDYVAHALKNADLEPDDKPIDDSEKVSEKEVIDMLNGMSM